MKMAEPKRDRPLQIHSIYGFLEAGVTGLLGVLSQPMLTTATEVMSRASVITFFISNSLW